jgi:hypothetical protein
MRKNICGVLVVLTTLVVASAGGGTFQLSVGPAYRGGMSVQLEGGTHVQELGLSMAELQLSDAQPLGKRGMVYPHSSEGAYSIAGFSDRTFDDGFVFMDPGTANPNAPLPGTTWFWGYDSASQYDGATDTLSFSLDGRVEHSGVVQDVRSDRSLTSSVLFDEPVDERESVSGYGVDFMLSYEREKRGTFGCDAVCGFTAIFSETAALSSTPFRERVEETRYTVTDAHRFTDTFAVRDTYTYDATGIVPPDAPYTGTYNGPGPLLPNQPGSQDRQTLDVSREDSLERVLGNPITDSYTVDSVVYAEVDADIYEVWLGPRLYWQTERICYSVIPHVTLGYVDVRVDRREAQIAHHDSGASETLREWTDAVREGEWVYGCGMLGSGTVDMGDWFLSVAGGYEWVPEPADVRIGPSTATFDSSGWTAKLGLGKAL